MQQVTDIEGAEARPPGAIEWITSTVGRVLISLFVPILTFVVIQAYKVYAAVIEHADPKRAKRRQRQIPNQNRHRRADK